MRYCTNCIYPETQDTIMFDAQGTCSVCQQIEFRDENIDWTERRKELDALVAQYRGRGQYDCIVPFSGGKDSTFQAWYVVKELGLRPLLVRFDHWFYRPLVHENNTRTLKILGVEMLNFTPNWHVVRELMLESLTRRGDFCWHCHTGVYAYPMQVAIRYDTPLIIWGESLAEYMSFYSYDEMEEVDEKRFNRAMNLGMTADDMYEFLGGRVERRDLLPFTYPDRKDLMRIKCRSVCLGSYIKWDTKKNVEIIKRELGWEGQPVEGIPPQYDYEKVECMMQGVRDYLKFIKRGFGRTNHLANIDIRNKRMSREEGWEMAQEYDGKRPASLDFFLDFLQISEEEFLELAMKHQVSPHEHKIEFVKDGAPLPDMNQWDRTLIEKPVGPPRDKKGKVKTYI
ncbi:MAG TPA: N-acetyl sugar amidotransferase [Candidatus Limnocylindria bacterium]|jgi:N-acetyl sugar amidotransferase|nr:N-acetyl sugar amidotransferase [Candidatus Limnocylindria bacterium]